MLTDDLFYCLFAYNKQQYERMNKLNDKEILKSFAFRVRLLRVKLGISQEELAERAGLHRTYIGMVERMERNPSLICIHKIAQGLNISIKELFED